jgi:mannose-6-phosphate isomerase-like protein (cupin superfamily)
MTKLKGLVPKGWGSEFIWATNDKYCGKFMNFETGRKFSMHFHKDKEETWYIQSGKFIVRHIDTKDASVYEVELNQGDTWHNTPCMPHQLECIEAGTVIEVSTPDSVEDNYRVGKGDSQNGR